MSGFGSRRWRLWAAPALLLGCPLALERRWRSGRAWCVARRGPSFSRTAVRAERCSGQQGGAASPSVLLSGAARAKIVGRRAKGLMASLEGWNEAVGLVLRASVKTGFFRNIDRNGVDLRVNRAQFGGSDSTAAVLTAPAIGAAEEQARKVAPSVAHVKCVLQPVRPARRAPSRQSARAPPEAPRRAAPTAPGAAAATRWRP